MNTGERPVQSKCGLLTTVAFRFGGKNEAAGAADASRVQVLYAGGVLKD